MIKIDEVSLSWRRSGGWRVAPAGLDWITKDHRLAVGDNVSFDSRAHISGDGVRIATNATINGYATISGGVMIGYGATIGDSAHIGDDVDIGTGATIGDGVTISNGATVDDDAVITDDV